MVDVRRAVASAVVGATGLAVAGIVLEHAVTETPPLSGLLLAGFGALVGAALAAGSVGVYRSSFTTTQTLRIGGWTTLGVFVTSAAVGLLYVYQAAVAAVPPAPLFSGAVVVGVSAVAHLLIGVNDARRVRAAALARERQKLAVLTRLVRHNLRTKAQYLYSYASRVRDGDDPETTADDIHDAGGDLAEMYETITSITDLFEDGSAGNRDVDLAATIDDVVAAQCEATPDATIETDVADGVTAVAGDRLGDAVEELVENAVEHNDSADPHVEVAAARDGDHVDVAVRDDGPGIPAVEREAVLGERELTQLDHGRGLGLCLVKWTLDSYGGDLLFDDGDEGGSRVTMRLRAA